MYAHRVTIGQTEVTLHDGYTVTRFPDGTEVCARHDDVQGLGQGATAEDLGYPDVPSMNQAHDVTHGFLAEWVGLEWSPVLYALAHGMPRPVHADIEEAAVLAIQRLCQALGIDLVALARARGGEEAGGAPPAEGYRAMMLKAWKHEESHDDQG